MSATQQAGQFAAQVYAEHEAFRMACEARWVLSMPSRDDRRAYLTLVEAKRGEAARRRLEREIKKIYDEQKAAQTG